MCYAGHEGETNPVGIMLGVAVIILSFFGGFTLMVDNIDSLSIGGILFLMLGVPLIGMIIGVSIILKFSRESVMTVALLQPADTDATEVGYVYEPPDICPNCRGVLNAETVDWVGPLTAKCPYCGSSVKLVKHRI